ncbi:ras-related protein Rab-17 isoform X2 [Sceloporus undulatus]|nr:ras-related protein Rab-17 isoform X2 [Sceloporus undulatus]XP_042302145.1 ras-related protein Rab-17 isoform X2 [Sceloporus undulatus]XP_042302146.1 ras-related protein Rab-17 isoform X2 [Sceloporus undulatus]
MAQRRELNMEATSCLDAHHPKESYVFKIVLLGSSSVGKSSLAYRYVKKDFRDSLPTVGCSFFTHILNLDNATIKLEIWDTAGQEKYHSVCHLYYRGANAAVLVYDITKKESLEKAKVWLRELEKEFLHDEIIIVLAGNKVDLSAEREVTLQEAKDFAKTKNMLHMETSAKTNHQVTELFTSLAHELLKQEQHKEKPSHTTHRSKANIDLRETTFNKIKCCQK